ncbi:MAG: Ig-like domain-containing protein [Lachnospiraceae bacterium]|nr:Ig-like domain-containing protein [Lachnospiraceae bacterium]
MRKKIVFCVLFLCMFFAWMPHETVKAASVKLNTNLVTTTVKKTYQLKIKGTKKKAKWTTGNKKVATVNKKGKVTAKGVGNTTITAKIGKKKYTCKVYVGQKQLVNNKNISVYYMKTTKKGISIFARNKMSKSKKAKMILTIYNYALDGQTPEGKRSGTWEGSITPGKVKVFTLNYSKGIKKLSHKNLSLYAIYGLYYSDYMDTYDISVTNKAIGSRYQPDNNYSALKVLAENSVAKLYYYKIEGSNLIVLRLENKTKEGLYGDVIDLRVNDKSVEQRIYDAKGSSDALVAPKSSANVYILTEGALKDVKSISGSLDLGTSKSYKEYTLKFRKSF